MFPNENSCHEFIFQMFDTGSCEVYFILDGVQLGRAHGIPVLGDMHPFLLTDESLRPAE